jgi:hypothetical protein
MIQLEAVLLLLDQLRAEHIEMLENPKGRDAFAFGEASGGIRAVAELKNRIEALVSAANQGDDTDR